MGIPSEKLHELQEKFARVDRLERRFSDAFITASAVGERISIIEVDIQDIQKALNDIAKINIDAAKGISSNVERSKTIEQIISLIQSKIDQQKSFHDKHFDKYLTIEKLEQVLENTINRLSKLERDKEIYANKTSVSSNIDAINKRCDSFDVKLSEIKTQIQSIQDLLNRISSKQSAHDNVLDGFNNRFEATDKSCQELTQSIEKLRDEYVSSLIKLEYEVFDRIDKRIKEKLPTIDENRIASLVKEMIQTEIANISVDSHNAYLKYNNLDNQVKLIEKKIENVFLLIKKFEISKIT